MAGEKQDSNWPLPKFYFSVDWGSLTNIAFQEISGLETETQPIDYRHDNNLGFSSIKMPGLTKFSNIVMKKGVFPDEKRFWEWYDKVKMNTIQQRQDVTIKLLGEDGNPTMTWSIKNAWPVKISDTDIKTDKNEVAIESMEISHEGFTFSTNG